MNIMLIGETASGKDSVHGLLPNYHRIALADPIRTIVYTMYTRGVGAAFVLADSMLDSAPENLMEIIRFYSQIPRTTKNKEVLQGIGTFMKDYQEDVWIKQGITKIKPHSSNVITDIRRYNEFKVFKDLGFKAIFIDCPEELRIQRIKDRDGEYKDSINKHRSESEIQGLKPLCDSVIVNDGTLNDLATSMDSVIAWLNFTETN